MSIHPAAAVRALAAGILFVTGCGETSTDPDPSESTVDRLLIEPLLARVTEPGDSVRYEAFTIRGDGSRRAVDAEWSSEPTDVVRLDERGTAVALREGSAMIEATYDGLRAVAAFFVNSDTVPPAIRTVFAIPERVSVSVGSEEVRVEAHFEDQRSSVESAFATFDGPLGGSVSGFVILELTSDSIEPDGVRVSVLEGILPIPGLEAVGTWTMSGLEASDAIGNTARWGASDLARLGLTVEVVVTVGSD